ncbi:tetratricopeptide repeat protein [Acuticoccus sediminis]|nr:tetratricopeptide repeat protein [Acuticoccus sediminis]
MDRPVHRSTTADERRQTRLDRMFDELAKATTKERADRIAGHILRRMTRSGSDTVDLLMNRSAVAIQNKDYGLALDLLDGVVRLKPDFAEGWNRRATVNFLAGNYGRSIADIEQVLKREPRHWGALVGLSVILVSLDQKARAVEVMTRALEIHPYLDDTRDRRDRFKMEIDGSEA